MGYLSYLKEEMIKWKSAGSAEFIFSTDKIGPAERVSSSGRPLLPSEYSKIHTTLYPQPIVGALLGSTSEGGKEKLLKGKFILCSLNPGFAGSEYTDEVKIGNLIENQYMQDSGASFFWVLPSAKGTAGYDYWTKKFDQANKKKSLVQNIIKSYKANGLCCNEKTIYEMISRRFVALELFPYHSKQTPRMSVRRACKSERNMYDFVHDILIPNAVCNQHLICFLRSYNANGWNITAAEKAKPNVICGTSVQNPTLGIGSDVGDGIYEFWRILSDGFTKII